MAYGTATLTGTYHTFDGQPASGVVEIIPNSRQLVDAEGDVILAGRVKVTLDEAGSFTVTLPATDDTTVEPATGRQYTVVAKLRHTHLAAVTGVELATGATVDVADVASAPVVDPAVSLGATITQLDALEADVTASLAAKADTTYVDTVLATKQDAGDYATTDALTTGLATKADTTAIPTAPEDINAEPAGLSTTTQAALAATYVGKDGNGDALLGPDLKVVYEDGNAGQRASLTGTSGAVMPYWQVTANTRTGTDGGSAVAGYQAHLGPDSGDGVNREFWFMEAVGELHADGPHFRMGTWASGTGVRRAFRLMNNSTAIQLTPNVGIEMKQVTLFDSGDERPVRVTRPYGRLKFVMSTQSDYGPDSSIFVLARNRGASGAAATPPLSADVLGTLQFGAMNGASDVNGAFIRGIAIQNWTYGSAEGSRLEFYVKANSTTSFTKALQLDHPASADQAGMMVAVNRAGTVTLSQVTIGAADSGGAGYRALRVPN